MLTALYSRGVMLLLIVCPVTSIAQSNPERLGSTYWVSRGPNNEPFVLELQERRRLVYVDATGAITRGPWKRRGTRIELETKHKSLSFTGTVDGDLMKGNASGKKGAKWEWSATKQPLATERSIPKYAALASAARIQGSVMLDLTVNAAGTVTSVNAISGHPLLRNLSAEAARDWRFRPIEDEVLRVARLLFTFRILDRERDERVRSPVFHSAYRVEIRRGIPSVQ
jgi:TonB family protein